MDLPKVLDSPGSRRSADISAASLQPHFTSFGSVLELPSIVEWVVEYDSSVSQIQSVILKVKIL